MLELTFSGQVKVLVGKFLVFTMYTNLYYLTILSIESFEIKQPPKYNKYICVYVCIYIHVQKEKERER